MSEIVVIEFDADGEAVKRLAVVKNDETQWLTAMECQDFSGDGMAAVTVLHGATIASHSVSLPNLSDNKLLKILPGILDDKMSVLGEHRHFALLPSVEEGIRLVAVMDCGVLERVKSQVAGLDLSLQAVVPDYSLLPVDPEMASVIRIDEKVCARLVDGTGFAAEPHQGSLMIAAAGDAEMLSDDRWHQILLGAISSDVNLLQGTHAPRGNIWAGLVWLKRSAIMATVALVLWVASVLLVGAANEQRANTLYQDAEQVFRAALPNVTRIVNMETQMRRAVADIRQQGGGELFALSGVVFQAVQDNPDTMLETFRYDGDEALLALSVSFSSFAESERFKEYLHRAGARVTEGSSRQEASRVFSEITIERAE